MGVILCATGNGPQSRLVQTAAVEAALARDALLVEIAAIARRDSAVTHLGPSWRPSGEGNPR